MMTRRNLQIIKKSQKKNLQAHSKDQIMPAVAAKTPKRGGKKAVVDEAALAARRAVNGMITMHHNIFPKELAAGGFKKTGLATLSDDELKERLRENPVLLG